MRIFITAAILLVLASAGGSFAQQESAPQVPAPEIPTALAGGSSAHQQEPAPEISTALKWVRPSEAFAIDTSGTFISNQFVDMDLADGYGVNALLPYLDDACPPGWEQLKDEEDGTPLFYAFGLLVSESGQPRSEYVRTPACVKQ